MGYIDKTGKQVINRQFDYHVDFRHGLAGVRMGGLRSGRMAYIDKKGNYIWQEE